MDQEANIKRETKISKLSEFFWVQIFTIIGEAIMLFLPLFFPTYTNWINDFQIYFYGISFLIILQIIWVVLTEFFKKNYLWNRFAYVAITFHVFVIYLTGGVESSFIFILFYVPVIALFGMDLKIIRNTGIASAILLSFLIFTDSKYFSDPSYITRHILNVLGICLFSFLVYRFVQKSLNQRLEKEQFKRRISELEELDHTKQVFLTAMSHQLRTPLNAVRWSLEASLKEENKNSELLIEGLKRTTQAIDTIGKILKISELEIENSDIHIEREQFDLKDLINRLVLEQNYLIKSHAINLLFERFEETIISGDVKMLSLALTNIIDNAMRYSPKGKVTINVFKSNQEGIFVIEDNGIGIDPKDIPYISSQKFFRGKNAIVVDPNESGIGLYTTRKIIEMHKGRMVISSELGKGTRVSVALPNTISE